jgi:glycerol-3-phosphate acyltransferase PlsY
MPIIFIIAAAVTAYLLGSLPVGVVAGWLVKGVEVRRIGSGRTGATNVYRAAGPLGMALTVLGDALKGLAAFQAAHLLGMLAVSGGADPVWTFWTEVLSGVAAIAGHNWSIWLRFKGGAGTVVTFGVLGAMNVYAAGATLLIGLVAMIVSHKASIGSLSIALAMGPVLVAAAALHLTPWAYVAFGILGGALTIYALIPNVKRILKGRERELEANY